MTGTERSNDRNAAEDDPSEDLVTTEGVNESDSSDSPGATLGEAEPAEPNEPG